jgi:excisionase family DNA binding protein
MSNQDTEGSDEDLRPWTVPQVAEYYQVHVNTVWRWIRQGRLPSVKVHGVRRVPADSVLDAIMLPNEDEEAERCGE